MSVLSGCTWAPFTPDACGPCMDTRRETSAFANRHAQKQHMHWLDPAGNWHLECFYGAPSELNQAPTGSPLTGLWLGAICRHKSRKPYALLKIHTLLGSSLHVIRRCRSLQWAFLVSVSGVALAAAEAVELIYLVICPLCGNIWLVYY